MAQKIKIKYVVIDKSEIIQVIIKGINNGDIKIKGWELDPGNLEP